MLCVPDRHTFVTRRTSDRRVLWDISVRARSLPALCVAIRVIAYALFGPEFLPLRFANVCMSEQTLRASMCSHRLSTESRTKHMLGPRSWEIRVGKQLVVNLGNGTLGQRSCRAESYVVTALSYRRIVNDCGLPVAAT